MVYEGDDVVVEWVDEDGDGTADRRRHYWLLPAIDQRLGFVDVDLDAAGDPVGSPAVYWYLCDTVGSIVRIVDAAGTVVNEYDYDAFGNIRWANSFATVPNRYTFQGREYDAHAGHYYYRHRTYIPEWGQFTGPNLDIRLTGQGPANYLFANNNPLDVGDPLGLEVKEIALANGDVRYVQRVPGTQVFRRVTDEVEALLGLGFAYSDIVWLMDEHWYEDPNDYSLMGWEATKWDPLDLYQGWQTDSSSRREWAERRYELAIRHPVMKVAIDHAAMNRFHRSVTAMSFIQQERFAEQLGNQALAAQVTRTAVEVRSVAGYAGNYPGSSGPGWRHSGGVRSPRCNGQLHHAISTRIHRALQQHPNLQGQYSARDGRFTTRAVDLPAHRGYQSWHRALDTEVVNWIKHNPGASAPDFENYLTSRYGQPDMLLRFPSGLGADR